MGENIIKPTILDKVAIFGSTIYRQYFFSKETKGKYKFRGLEKDGIDGVWRIVYDDDHNATCYQRLKNCSLLVKPLENISKADCRELFKVFFGNYIERLDPKKHPFGYSGKDHDKVAANIVKEYLFGPNPTVITPPTLDFLRGRGYGMSYKQWGVEDLVEFGIYKFVD